MRKVWQILNQEISFLSIVALFMAAFLIACRMDYNALTFFWSMDAIIIASVIMLVYLAVKWKHLSKSDRWGIVLTIFAWFWLLYGIIHAEGLTIMSYFYFD